MLQRCLGSLHMEVQREQAWVWGCIVAGNLDYASCP